MQTQRRVCWEPAQFIIAINRFARPAGPGPGIYELMGRWVGGLMGRWVDGLMGCGAVADVLVALGASREVPGWASGRRGWVLGGRRGGSWEVNGAG